MTTRMLPPTTGAFSKSPTKAFDRSYTPVAGSFVDAPDHDADHLAANGWTYAAGPRVNVGPTSARPTSHVGDGTRPRQGTLFLDTTLGYIVVYDGAAWRNPATGAAV